LNFRHQVVGQQIAYFYGDGKEDFVVAENIEDALKLQAGKNFKH
jgi:valyl-tRNA synthetase